MPEKELTEKQKAAFEYRNRLITYQKVPGQTIQGHFEAFTQSSTENGTLRKVNSAETISIPLDYIINFCKEEDEAKKAALGNSSRVKKSSSDNPNA